MITNDTIIKAAKAAGLDDDDLHLLFDPRYNDTDNAMIRRGAEIDAVWISRFAIAATYIEIDGRVKQLQVNQEFKNDKAQAEREAVILCAAAKWDAMNTPAKSMFEPDEEDQDLWAGDDMMGASG